MNDLSELKQAVSCAVDWFKKDPRHWTQKVYARTGNGGRLERSDLLAGVAFGSLTPIARIDIVSTCILGAVLMCTREASTNSRRIALENNFVSAFTREIGQTPIVYNDWSGREVAEVIWALEKVHATL